MHRVEPECPLKEYPLGHAFLYHSHKEKMKSASPHCLLNSDRAPFALKYIVKNHSPSAPPAEDSLNSDHYIQEIACVAFYFSFPFAALNVLVDSFLDHFSSPESLLEQLASLHTAVKRLDLRCILVHRIKDRLVNELLHRSFHENLRHTESPLFLSRVGWAVSRSI